MPKLMLELIFGDQAVGAKMRAFMQCVRCTDGTNAFLARVCDAMHPFGAHRGPLQ